MARDGIEPPTPAFSGPNSFTAMMLKLKAESYLDAPKMAHLLGQEWDKIMAAQNCLSHCWPAGQFRFFEVRHFAVPEGGNPEEERAPR